MEKNKKSNKQLIVLSGGGTGGSVAPLLAIHEELKGKDNFEFIWLGTKKGIEKAMVEKENIIFKAIFSGKLRRYFSWQNFTDLAKIKLGFWQSLFIMIKRRPDLIISAGSFVSVPVVWAGWLLRIPILIHQQDMRPGLANFLMAPMAKVITVTFEKSLEDYGQKAVWTGNPVRKIFNFQFSISKPFEFDNNLPIVLIIGGGTGAMAINNLVGQSLEELSKVANIIHVTGKNKNVTNYILHIANYKSFEFLNADEMAEALKKAEVVVSRAGMSTLTELSYLGKPSILIPIPESHQEDNAKFFRDKNAAIVLNQKELSNDKFISEIKKLLTDKNVRENLSLNMLRSMKSQANESITSLVLNLLENKNKR